MNKNASVGIPMKKICGRLTRILCTCAVFVSLTGAAYAQSAPVTLDRKKAPVREILNEIERQTDYLFVYSSEQVDFSVSVTAHDEPVQTVLRRIFEGTPIRFTLEGKHIVLRRQPQTAANAAAASPAKQTVTGTVTDTAGKPVVGATVLVKGGTVGTTTDVDGRFSLTIPAGSPLEVSFLGYARQEIATPAARRSISVWKRTPRRSTKWWSWATARSSGAIWWVRSIRSTGRSSKTVRPERWPVPCRGSYRA